jgi:hypothetical protein
LKNELFEKEKQIEKKKIAEIQELFEKQHKEQHNYESQCKEVIINLKNECNQYKNQIQTMQANVDMLIDKAKLHVEKEVKELWNNEAAHYKEKLEKANQKILEQDNQIEYEKLQKQLVIQRETLVINEELSEKYKIKELEMKKRFDTLEQQYKKNEEKLKQKYETMIEESKKMDKEKQNTEKTLAEFKLSSQYEMQQLERKQKDNYEKLLATSTEKLTKQVQELQDECKKQKIENEELRNKEREIYLNEILKNNEEREESKRQMLDLNTKLETISASGSKIKGMIGEREFYDLVLNTFKDFSMFHVSDMTKVANSGDFHLTFENFTVLVDCKKYSTNVGAVNREKLRKDLTITGLKIAWMVSLGSPHDKFGKHPFMIDYLDIEHKRCIIYINSLLEHTNPQELLKTVWYTSDMIHRMVLSRDDNDELENLKTYQKHVYDCAKKMEEITKRQVNLVDQVRELFGDSNKLIKELLMNEFIKATDVSIVEEWLSSALEKNPLAKRAITSTNLYERFKDECIRHHISQMEFKAILEKILDSECIRKPKTATGKLTIIGYSWVSK